MSESMGKELIKAIKRVSNYCLRLDNEIETLRAENKRLRELALSVAECLMLENMEIPSLTKRRIKSLDEALKQSEVSE